MNKSLLLRISAFITAVIMLAGALSSCVSFESGNDGKIRIVCTVFPVYDWVKNIAGDSENVDIILLGGSGVDMHNYQPSVADIVKITTSDVFIYVGGESDDWVDKALEKQENKDMKILNLMSLLGDKALDEEHKEGMEHEHEEEGEEDEIEKDEHIWMSLANAAFLCEKISDAIAQKDAASAEKYRSNADKYISDINALKDEYAAKISEAPGKTIVVADRFPFLYMAKEFGFDYYAAFAGCSAETEASFKTISTLAGKVKELNLKYVVVTDGSDRRIAGTVISESGVDCQIVELNSLQAVSLNQIESGYTYLGIMKQDLELLLTVLG